MAEGIGTVHPPIPRIHKGATMDVSQSTNDGQHMIIDEILDWQIIFCPRFFMDDKPNTGPRYINRITSGPKKQPQDLGTLISYEYIIIHEWFHVDMFGYAFHSKSPFLPTSERSLKRQPVADIKGTYPGSNGEVRNRNI